MCYSVVYFFFSSRRRHTRCALVTGVQTCALPISDYVRFVDLADYLRGLVEDLRQSVDQKKTTLQFLASETRISTDIAVPVGVIEIGRASCRERVCQYV